jgi:hypothetical protein
MTNYELFWLRELPGGALGGDYGVWKTSIEDLPINETLAGRIRRLSAPGTDVSLHFPFLNYRDRHDWPARQLELPVSLDEYSRRITIGDDAEHQFASLLAAPILAGTSAPIVFRDERVWQAQDWNTAVVPMLAAHKVKLDDSGWEPQGKVNLRWTVELPAHLSTGWTDVPHRRDAGFLEQFRGVSTSIQLALRNWIPYQYFADPQRFTKPHFSHSYLVYGVLPPHPSRRKTQLTFHVLEPQRVIRSLGRLGRPLALRLRRVQACMEADGLLENRDAYLVENARQIIGSMHSLPRTFAALLSLEAFVVEEFLSFGTTAHELREAPRRARLFADPALALLHSLRCRLARSYGGESYQNLVNLILIAATAGLAWRETPKGAMRCHVVATELETGREIRGESQFSYAISHGGSHC